MGWETNICLERAVNPINLIRAITKRAGYNSAECLRSSCKDEATYFVQMRVRPPKEELRGMPEFAWNDGTIPLFTVEVKYSRGIPDFDSATFTDYSLRVSDKAEQNINPNLLEEVIRGLKSN